MADFEVEVKGAKELRQAFRDYPKIAEPILQRTVLATNALLAKYTRKGIVPWKTGYLAQHWAFVAGRLFARWSPLANYATFVHEGTRPHWIQATEAEALYWQGAKHPVAAVFHPGYAGNPFIPRIIKAATPEINRIFVQALDQVNREIANRVRPF